MEPSDRDLDRIVDEISDVNRELNYLGERLVHYLEALVSMVFVLIALLGILLYRLW